MQNRIRCNRKSGEEEDTVMEQKRTSKLAKKRKLLQNIKGDRKMNSFVGDTANGMLNEQKEVASVK